MELKHLSPALYLLIHLWLIAKLVLEYFKPALSPVEVNSFMAVWEQRDSSSKNEGNFFFFAANYTVYLFFELLQAQNQFFKFIG